MSFLPSDLAAALPADLDTSAARHLRLRGSREGERGETYVVAAAGQTLCLTRASIFGPFELLDLQAPPILQPGARELQLRFSPNTGEPFAVPVSRFEEAEVRALLEGRLAENTSSTSGGWASSLMVTGSATTAPVDRLAANREDFPTPATSKSGNGTALPPAYLALDLNELPHTFGPDHDAEALLELADEVFIRNDLDGAIGAVREAIKRTEDAAERDQYEILLQAMRCYRNGEYALSALLLIESFDAMAIIESALLFSLADKLEAARDFELAAHVLHYEDDSLVERFQSFLRRADLDESQLEARIKARRLRELTSRVEAHPNDSWWREQFAEALWEIDALQEAVVEAQRAAEPRRSGPLDAAAFSPSLFPGRTPLDLATRADKVQRRARAAVRKHGGTNG